MDARSSTRKVLPYESLLCELRTLIMKNEGSIFMRGLQPLQQTLRFQQMVFMFLKNMVFSDNWVLFEALDRIQSTAKTAAEPIMEAAKGLSALRGLKAYTFYFEEVRSCELKFLKTIDQKVKPDLKEFCLENVNRLLRGNSSREYEIFEFFDVIFLELKNLQISKPNMTVLVKKQMETLEEMLHFISKIVEKETNLDENLLVCFRPWVDMAAALVIMYWVDVKYEELFVVVSPSLQKFNLGILELAETYIAVINALKPSNVSEILMMRKTVGRVTNIVLENLIVSTDVRFEMFRDGLALCIALLVDPPQADAEDEKSVCARINLQVKKAEYLIRSLCLDKLGEDIVDRRNILLNDFLEKMNKAKAEVRQLHVEIPGLSWNVPRTNGIGFFDFLLGNLQKKLGSKMDMFPFEKHLIVEVQKELSLLRTFLMDIFLLQDEHKELRDIWVQASTMAYLVDYITDSCLSFSDVPIWSNLMHLSSAIEQIHFVKNEVTKIRMNDQMYANKVISAKLNSKLVLPRRQQVNATTEDDIKVGFKKEEQRIIDRLIAGEDGLDIVAIVGMAGQGKTNLAQRVFQNVQHHFIKYACCCISQAYNIKDILQVILKNVGESKSQEQLCHLTQEDLAHRLYKCLKGRKYLLVLDDMWDAKAWNELKSSFPDDNIKSRILLTSRNSNVAGEVKVDCCIVELHPLSHEESWNLLQMKVSGEDFCPSTLFDIGKTIAKNCKGLPLAIVVVAGLLKKDENVDSWKKISENLKSHIASEGCMDILDLSYKLLPDYLRPCFLYLGAFKEDERIDVKRLIQLWIVEGFVKNDGMKSMEVVAYEYLIDLVARSLVFVSQRSSGNKIKRCHLHDLLRELCLIKAEEERFLWLPNMSNNPSSIRCDHYRLCVNSIWQYFDDSGPIFPMARALLVFGNSLAGISFPPSFLKRFKLLRVLVLSNVVVRRVHHFDEITQLIHLRLLSVICRFSIPSTIVNLSRLEVIRVQYPLFGQLILPSVVMKMENLRHICINSCRFGYSEDFDEMQLRMSPSFTNFETVISLDFEEESSFRSLARKLPNVLKLGLRLSFCVLLSSYFRKLESLNLCILLGSSEAISPSTLDFPLTLKKLNLSTEAKLSRTMISSIGKLSNLEVLKLKVEFEYERWDVEHDEFMKLKYLRLRNSAIKEWNVSEESFRFLEQLVVYNCHQLGELPGRFGAITNLKRIEVEKCNESVSNSFQQIVDDQIEYGNEDLQSSIH